jgi:serine beta-lactamase-like protein LACTB, mitochondrial
MATSPAKRADAALAKIAPDYPGLSATVFVKGKPVWSGATGYADIENHLPITADTRFNIYSTSKAVTGLAFAHLVDKGQISLDTSVGEVAPELPAALHHIRLKHILSHTSGIRHYTSQKDWLSFAQKRCAMTADAPPYFQDDALVNEPGAAEHYSSFAFVLASHLLTRITKEGDFARAINRTLHTRFTLDGATAVKSVAYLKAGQLPALPAGRTPEDIVPSPIASAECKFGGGGLIATSGQLAHIGALLAEGRIIPKAKLNKTLQPWSEVSSVVYGGGIGKIDHAGKLVNSFGLSGGAPGGRSYLLVLIEPRISVAITGNFDGPNLEAAAREIAQAF